MSMKFPFFPYFYGVVISSYYLISLRYRGMAKFGKALGLGPRNFVGSSPTAPTRRPAITVTGI